MQTSIELLDISNAIESLLCAFGEDYSFNDRDALQLIEMYFDINCFNDSKLPDCHFTQRFRYSHMNKVINEELSSIPKERLIKILATIYRSIQRHTNGDKEYLSFAQCHVGSRIGPGLRLIKE